MSQKNEEIVATQPILPLSVEEPAITVVEKQRFNKNRNVAKQENDPALSHHYGPHYLKTTFLIDRSHIGGQPSNEEVHLGHVYHNLAQRYSSLDWKVNTDAMQSCLMTTSEKKTASTRQPNAAFDIHGYQQPKPMQSRDLTDLEHAQIRRKKRVLVPISGGISSLATLWWCLQRDFDVFLCYGFDSLSSNAQCCENPFEIQCLLRLLQYARQKNGKLLFESTNHQGDNIYELTRNEIQQRIKVVQVPLSCYYLDKTGSVSNIMKEPTSLKAHPQSYLLFYRQMLIVAQSLSCSSIAIGMYGDGKTLLQAANSFWTTIHKHELLFPFQTRVNALETFQEACEESWLVWKSFFQPNEERSAGIWQTAGPSIMPNAAHYVTTCNTRPAKTIETKMLEAQGRALEKVEQLIFIDTQNEQDAIDDATARGEKLRKKRAPDPFQHSQYLSFFLKELESTTDSNDPVFNFCNSDTCPDCSIWKSTTNQWYAKNDSLRSKWQNLASEYCSRLRANLERKDQTVVNIIAKNLPKKRELALADVVSKPSKKSRVDEDLDVDDKNVEEEVDEEEDDEEEDLYEEEQDEEEENDEEKDEEEEDEAVILAEDEEVQEVDEEEEEGDDEEKEKDEEEEEEEEDLDEELDEEDEEDDDDDENDDGDEDY